MAAAAYPTILPGAAPPPGSAAGGGSFNQIDTNNDGVVTREEFSRSLDTASATSLMTPAVSPQTVVTLPPSLLPSSGSPAAQPMQQLYSAPAAPANAQVGSVAYGSGTVGTVATSGAPQMCWAPTSGPTAQDGAYINGSSFQSSASPVAQPMQVYSAPAASPNEQVGGSAYSSGTAGAFVTGGVRQTYSAPTPPTPGPTAQGGSYITGVALQSSASPVAQPMQEVYAAPPVYVAPPAAPPSVQGGGNAYTTGTAGAFASGGVPQMYSVPTSGQTAQGGAYVNGGTTYTAGGGSGGVGGSGVGAYGIAGIGSQPGGVADASGMKLFMDDNKNWTAIADIAQAFLVIESDEEFLAEELSKIPGGKNALAFLRGSSSGALPPGWVERTDPATGKPYYVNAATGETSATRPGSNPEEALGQVRQSIEAAKRDAHIKAEKAQDTAVRLRKDAEDSKRMADEAEEFGEMDGLEHMALVNEANAAQDAERKADAEAQRLARQAEEAARMAAQAQAEYEKALQHAHHHHHYANEVSQRAAQVQQAQQSMPDFHQHAKDAADLTIEAAKTDAQAKKAAQRARDLQQKMAELEKERPEQIVQQVYEAERAMDTVKTAKSHASQARRREQGLAAFIEVLKKQHAQAQLAAQQAEQMATTQEQQLAPVIQKAERLPVKVAGRSPEEIRADLDRFKQEAADAQRTAYDLGSRAAQLGQQAKQAQQGFVKGRELSQQASADDGLDYDAEKARLAAEQAKARANALMEAARQAALHAHQTHQRKDDAVQKLQQQQEHTKVVVGKERAAWQQRFGDLPPGWRAETDPATGRTYFIGPNGETTWKKPRGVAPGGPGSGVAPGEPGMSAQETGALEEKRAAEMLAAAQKATEDAAKAEADAQRMDKLVKALERAIADRSILERDLANFRHEAVNFANDVEKASHDAEGPISVQAQPSKNVPYGQGAYMQGGSYEDKRAVQFENGYESRNLGGKYESQNLGGTYDSQYDEGILGSMYNGVSNLFVPDRAG